VVKHLRKRRTRRQPLPSSTASCHVPPG
jgi:hypothetical protein